MAVTKGQVLLFMIASLVSGGLAVLLAIGIGAGSFLTISLSGFIVGGFFAYKYATFDKAREREEQHRRDRQHRRNH